MQQYYSKLEALRGHLRAAGLEPWAIELLSAERAASTSGEALSTTGVVLKRLLQSQDLDTDLRAQAQSIYDEGDVIWNRGRD
jgi:hypothetical protein